MGQRIIAIDMHRSKTTAIDTGAHRHVLVKRLGSE
jgi:hypothetical protein